MRSSDVLCFSLSSRNVSWEWIMCAWWSRSFSVCLCWWLPWLQVYAPGEELGLLIRGKRNPQSKNLSERRAIRPGSDANHLEKETQRLALDKGIDTLGKNWVLEYSPWGNAAWGFLFCFCLLFTGLLLAAYVFWDSGIYHIIHLHPALGHPTRGGR